MNSDVRDKFKQKQKIEDDIESVKPTVINDALIENYMHEYHRENKIFGMEHMRIWDLTHLSLSFKSKHCLGVTVMQTSSRSTTCKAWKS